MQIFLFPGTYIKAPRYSREHASALCLPIDPKPLLSSCDLTAIIASPSAYAFKTDRDPSPTARLPERWTLQVVMLPKPRIAPRPHSAKPFVPLPLPMNARTRRLVEKYQAIHPLTSPQDSLFGYNVWTSLLVVLFEGSSAFRTPPPPVRVVAAG